MRSPTMASLPASLAEYVNLREPSMDIKSVTDRAAQTLLWTELARGRSWGLGRVGWGWVPIVREEGPHPPCVCCSQAWA